MQKSVAISSALPNQKSAIPVFDQGKTSSFFKPVIQPKLTINQPNDSYEQEADTVADKVMRMTDKNNVQTKFFQPAISTIQRKCKHCEEEEKKMQRKEINGEEATADNDIESYVGALDSGGESLSKEVRSFYEPKFGYNFNNVKVHTSTIAAKSARSVNALAYTSGNNIVFNNGQYSPDTDSGKKLLAHELTHVVQQVPGAIMRQCLTGAPCTPPIAGAPGQFVTAEETRQAPVQAERTRQVESARRAARPPVGTAPAVQDAEALRQVQADRHGQRATNLERVAVDNGLDLSTGNIVGIFIDRDISPNYGAVTRLCSQFTSFVTPPTADANKRCVFVPVSLEDQAVQYYADSSLAQIGPFTRNLWLSTTIRTLMHERQHVIYDTSSHDYTGTGCNRTTVLYTSGTRTYDVNYYLSELSAGLSEFLAHYNTFIRTSDRSIKDYILNTWLRNKVETSNESIKGILTALRCRCDCREVDAYIRDTFVFTTRSWPIVSRVILNSLLAQYPGLNWPLQGGEPNCIDDCERRFDACTSTSSSGGMMCLAQRGSCFNNCSTTITP